MLRSTRLNSICSGAFRRIRRHFPISSVASGVVPSGLRTRWLAGWIPIAILSAWWIPAAIQGEIQQVASVEGITEYVMDNGLHVLLFPDASKPTFTVNITYRVGSRHEGRGEAGMAHLLEHMVFKGTPTYAKIWDALEEHGANFNGTTWLDRTNYYETMPASEENLRFALHMEADRMINSRIAQEDLDKEMSVVRNEFEAGENNPQAVLNERMISAAFLWHNYGKSTIGNRSDIERVPASRLKAFYKKYYQPDNAVLLVAGKFDPETTLQLIAKEFGAIPRPERKLDATYTEEPPQDGDRLVRLYRTGDVATVGLVYHIPPGPHDDFAPIEIFQDLLTNRPTGRLYRGLVANGLASDVGGFTFKLAEPGVMVVLAEVGQDQTPEEVLATMTEIVESFGESEIDEEQVQLAVARELKSIKLAMTNSQRIGIGLSESIAQGDWRLFFIHRDRLEKVTAADVQRVASTYFIRSNRTAGIFTPTEDPRRAHIPLAPDVTALVEGYQGRAEISQGEALPTDVAAIEERIERLSIAEGIQLAILPMETRGDSVKAKFRFHYGTEETLTGKALPESLAPLMVMRGTTELDYEALNNAIDRLESQISVSSGREPGIVTASIQSDREHFAATIELLADILQKPAFDAKEFEIIKRQMRSRMEQGLSDPQAQGMLRLSQALRPWPKESIHYVPTIEEEIQQLDDATLEDVKEFHDQFYGASACEIAIVGDFDPDEIQPLIRQRFARWQAPQAYQRIIRPYRKTEKADHVVNTPDKEMALVATACALPVRDDQPEYPAMKIASYVLGQSPTSRLMNRLRHEDGLSYGTQGGITASSQDKRGALLGLAICAPQNAEKAAAALKEEIDTWIADGITEEELTEAKNSYALKFKSRIANDHYLVTSLAEGLELKRTLVFQQQLLDKIQALTVDDIRTALQQTFADKQRVSVAAGDFRPKTLEAANARANLLENDGSPANAEDSDDPWAKLITLDKNDNGKLERSEVPGPLKAAFEDIDANKDGALDRDEIQAAIDFSRQQP